jgi:hypothetical protein
MSNLGEIEAQRLTLIGPCLTTIGSTRPVPALQRSVMSAAAFKVKRSSK